MDYLPVFSFLSVATIAVFSFISVTVWSQNRRREREAFYRHEVLKRLTEMKSEGAEQVLRVMREEERRNGRILIEGLKIGGLACMAAGAGIVTLLWGAERARMAGVIPLFVGVALLIYVFVLAPKE